MGNHASHACLPYPIYGARYTVFPPYLDADGDPTAPVTPDTEYSQNGSASWTDTAEEITDMSNGLAMLTFTSLETLCNSLSVQFKVASGPKNTLGNWFPRRLPVIATGTLVSGAWTATGGTLPTILPYDITNCFFRQARTSVLINALNEARRITAYDPVSGVFTVTPDFEVVAAASVPYEILLPEGVTMGMLTTLRPEIDGRRAGVGPLGHMALDWGDMAGESAIRNLDNTRVRLHTDYDLYYATEIRLTRDQANGRDEYTVAWTFDGAPIESGITSPTIEVVKRSDGTNLVAETAMTQIGSTGVYKYDETTEANRVSFGEAVIVIARATITGATRTTRKVITLDSV
jgi:hypothetical protein